MYFLSTGSLVTVRILGMIKDILTHRIPYFCLPLLAFISFSSPLYIFLNSSLLFTFSSCPKPDLEGSYDPDDCNM